MKPCPDEISLSCYHDKELEQEDREIIEEHLATCLSCKKVLASFEHLDRFIDDVESPSSSLGPKTPKRTSWLKRGALAASFACLVAFGFQAKESDIKTYHFEGKENYIVSVKGKARLISLKVGDIEVHYEKE